MRISIPSPVPRFPDHIAAPAPIGMRDSVRRAAAQAGISSAAFIRAAIEDRLRAHTYEQHASFGGTSNGS